MSPSYNECHHGMVWNFDPSIHNRLEREFWHGDDIRALANKVSEMIDHQEQNKVWTMMIIPQSVEVELRQDTSRCDMTANEVNWKSCCNRYVWHDQHNVYIYITLGCASGSGILVLFLVPSLQVLYLTMLLAQRAEHRGLITNNYWSISDNEAVFTLCIIEWSVSMDTYNINDITWRTQLWNGGMTMGFRSVAVKL